ncbi:hypothetical protein LTR37_008120 [Vermiconidia calcicola]|uniref:Uncharacterized protein n=1 Tax=Vermiconidia calcicola TaxID=1690605 RepID=A0ACC3NC85_9PEZI|nr:hypothetical protein LTR37_008120 [Vermiconidia calcicola]
MGSGIFTQDGAAWKHSRDLLRPQFASNRYQNFEEIKNCVKSLIGQIPKDDAIDLQPLFFRLTFDSTTFLLFGETTSSLQSAEIAGQESEFVDAFNLGQGYLTTHSFVDAAVQRALDAADGKKEQAAGEKQRYVFIDALVQQTREKKVLRDQCLNVLLAGRDTTACCLTWTMQVNTVATDVLSTLRSEIQSIIGLGPNAARPTREDLKRMTYLNIVIKEVLRLYPSVPVNSRAAVRRTTLPVGGGPDGQSSVLVRKGEAVGYCVYAMHRRKDIYGPDAYKFRPERWEGDALRDVGYGYLPFNGGPRVCLGQDFAISNFPTFQGPASSAVRKSSFSRCCHNDHLPGSTCTDTLKLAKPFISASALQTCPHPRSSRRHDELFFLERG